MFPSLDTAFDLQEAVRSSARDLRVASGLKQTELSERSGVPLGTLKRFERTGEISLSGLLALAEALDALEGFRLLFPRPEPKTLDDLARPPVPSKVARVRRAK